MPGKRKKLRLNKPKRMYLKVFLDNKKEGRIVPLPLLSLYHKIGFPLIGRLIPFTLPQVGRAFERIQLLIQSLVS
jgi:hypothetical protein